MQKCTQVVTYEKMHRIVYLFIQLVPWLCIAALGIKLRALWMLGQHCTIWAPYPVLFLLLFLRKGLTTLPKMTMNSFIFLFIVLSRWDHRPETEDPANLELIKREKMYGFFSNSIQGEKTLTNKVFRHSLLIKRMWDSDFFQEFNDFEFTNIFFFSFFTLKYV